MVHNILEDAEQKENFIQVRFSHLSLVFYASFLFTSLWGEWIKQAWKSFVHVSPLSLCLQHVFPVEYGSGYDAVLQSLAWEFLSRVEDLLPVPNLKEVCSRWKIEENGPSTIINQTFKKENLIWNLMSTFSDSIVALRGSLDDGGDCAATFRSSRDQGCSPAFQNQKTACKKQWAISKCYQRKWALLLLLNHICLHLLNN